MVFAFGFSVARVGQALLNWRLHWNSTANIVAVVGVLPGAVGPLRAGDIIRSVNGASDVSEILERLCFEPGPFDIEVERFDAFEAAERPPRAIGLEGVKVSDRGQKSQAACAFCPLSLTLTPSKQGWSGCSTARPGGALSLPPA
jgi:hypothetical protein